MFWRTNPRAHILWRDESTVSFGAHPDAVSISGLSAGEGRIVAALERGVSGAELRLLCRERGVPDERGEQLVAQVRPALVDPRLPPDTPASTFAEFSDGALAPLASRLIAARADTTVSVHGTGELAETLRLAIARMHFARADEARSGTGRETRRVVVLVSSEVPNPLVYRQLLAHDTPHIAVLTSMQGALVLAPVVPGRTPCLRCRECHRTESDPGVVHAALAVAARPAHPLDTATLLAATAATCQSLARLVDFDDIADSVAVTTHGNSAEPAWEFHPDCGCQAFEWRASA